MSLPSLRKLQAPGIPVVICARPWARELLEGVEKEDFIPMQGPLFEDRAALYAHRQNIKHRKQRALGLIFPNSLSSAAVFALAGLPSAGYRSEGRSILLRWPFAKPTPPPHAVQTWYTLSYMALRCWGLAPGAAQAEPRLHLPLSAAHYAQAQQVLSQAGLAGQAFVLIAPTATGRHYGRIKVWNGFEQLSRALRARGYTVIMCPPPNEIHAAQNSVPSAQLLDSLPLGAFAALLTHAKLVVCNDSGVSHLAAAVAARQLTLFGVTQPTHTGPWSPHAVCLGSDQGWPTFEAVQHEVFTLLKSTP
jgi:heptosyltransferase-2